MSRLEEQTPQYRSNEELLVFADFRRIQAMAEASMRIIGGLKDLSGAQKYINIARIAIEGFRQKTSLHHESYTPQIAEMNNILDNAEITLQGATR